MLTSNGGRGWSFCGWGCWRCNGMLIWWWPRRPPLCCNLVLRFSSSSSEESPSSSESSSESTPEAVVATSRSEHWMAGSDRDLDGVRWVEWLGNFYVHQSDKERGKKWIQYYEVDLKNIGKKPTLEQLIFSALNLDLKQIESKKRRKKIQVWRRIFFLKPPKIGLFYKFGFFISLNTYTTYTNLTLSG